MNDYEQGRETESQKFIGERPNVRSVFLRKLYFLVAVQFFLATIVQYFAGDFESFRTFLNDQWIIALVAGCLLALLILLVYFLRSTFRRTPLNVITYVIFVLVLVYTIAYFSAGDLSYMVTTSLTILSLSLFAYALTTRLDLTFLGGTIYVLGAGLASYGIFLIGTDMPFFTLVWVTLLMVTLGFYLIYDTRFLIVGQSLNSDNEDPFISSIIIYLDIVFLVFRLLENLGKVFKRNRY